MPPDEVQLPIALVIAVATVWIAAAALLAFKAWRRPPLLVYEPRRPVPWGANDLVLTLLFVAVLGCIAGQTVDHFFRNQDANSIRAAEFYTNSAIELLGVGIGIILMKFQARATWTDLGLDTSRLARDLGLGAAAFLGSVVPLFVLQNVLVHWIPYKQPLIEAVNAKPDTAMFISTAVAALIAAPIFEEFVFRVLLQGWFEAIEARRRVLRLGLPGEGPAWWPIVLSAALFAMLHYNQMPAPIPLFFLALVLGYLYQRTHRIWPSMVAHFLLNATSMWILWSQIQHVAM